MGRHVAPAIHTVSAVADGFAHKLTVPVPAGVADADIAAALAIKSWVYRDAPDYGSPELDEHAEPIAQVKLSSDRRNRSLATTVPTTQPTAPASHERAAAA